MQFNDVPIRNEDIRLGQFIKLANLADTGGDAKELIAAGAVFVNGEADTRRGKQLRVGDVVEIRDADTGAVLSGARVAACPQACAQGAGQGDAAGVGKGEDAGDDDLGEFFDEATADDDFDPEKWRNL